jgi:hypothetical protein
LVLSLADSEKISARNFQKPHPLKKRALQLTKANHEAKKDPRSPEGECLRIGAGGRLCETGERGKTATINETSHPSTRLN